MKKQNRTKSFIQLMLEDIQTELKTDISAERRKQLKKELSEIQADIMNLAIN